MSSKTLLDKISNLLNGDKKESIHRKLEVFVSENAHKVLKSVWVNVKLGVYKNGERLLGAMQALGFVFGSWAEKLLSSPNFPVSSTEIEVDLVELHVGKDLGFENGSTWSKIFEKIVELGYELCPAEVGPVLRMKHDKQIKNEFRWVAMQPIMVGGYFHVFYVDHRGGGRWLSASDCTDSDFSMASDFVVVAVRPRKVS